MTCLYHCLEDILLSAVLALLAQVHNGRLCGQGESSTIIIDIQRFIMAVKFTTYIDLWCFFCFFSFVQGRRHIEEDKLDFKGGNVHVITSKEDWDRKIEEANKDGKIVSKLTICSMDYKYIFWFFCCALVGDLSVCFTLYNFMKLISMHYLSHGPFSFFFF